MRWWTFTFPVLLVCLFMACRTQDSSNSKEEINTQRSKFTVDSTSSEFFGYPNFYKIPFQIKSSTPINRRLQLRKLTIFIIDLPTYIKIPPKVLSGNVLQQTVKAKYNKKTNTTEFSGYIFAPRVLNATFRYKINADFFERKSKRAYKQSFFISRELLLKAKKGPKVKPVPENTIAKERFNKLKQLMLKHSSLSSKEKIRMRQKLKEALFFPKPNKR